MSAYGVTEHHIMVDGKRIDFSVREVRPGELLVSAPGVMQFSVSSLDEARNIVRSLFIREQEN